MKYLYIEHLQQGGYRIQKDIENTCGREGSRYYGYSKQNAVKQFRRDFDVIGKHFTIIEY